MKQKGKILVIEDLEFWQSKLREYLEADGFYVEVAEDIETALNKLRNERFHFITVDMQLDENTITPTQYEGWPILEVVKKLRIQGITPVMVVTAFGKHYNELKNIKNVESLFFMEKQDFDKSRFLEIINTEVDRIDLRFKDDHRGG